MTGTIDQCLAQCLVIDEQNYGYCWDEQTAHFACLAAGGYTCTASYPQPKSTCFPEGQALNACAQKTPCLRFCERAAGQCAPQGSECLSSCMAKSASFEDSICGHYYTQLVSCWGQSLTCNGEIPAIGSCGAAAVEVAGCVARRQHVCEGYCWLAQALGCGSDNCSSECRAKVDSSTCGSQYRNLIECTYDNREVRMTCENGSPAPSEACASYRTSYETCIATH